MTKGPRGERLISTFLWFGTSLLPAMKVREDWVLGIVVEHPNLPAIAAAQSRFSSSNFVKVFFNDWYCYFAEFIKIDFS